MNLYDNIDQKKNNTLRQIEINNYYSLKKTELIDILKTIIIGSIIIIAIFIINKFNIIPDSIKSLLSITLITIITIISIIKYYNINNKDPRNFNNIIIPFDAENQRLEDSGKSSNITDILDKEFHGGLGCYNQSCCTGNMKFDSNKKKCVITGESLDTPKDDLEKDIGSKIDFVSSVNKLDSNIKQSYKELGELDVDTRTQNLKNIGEKM